MAPNGSLRSSRFDPPEDAADQSVVSFSTGCFEDLHSLMGEGDWVSALKAGCPRTRLGRSLWKYLLYIRRNIADHAPKAPNLTGQTKYFFKEKRVFQMAFDEVGKILDDVCDGEDDGERAVVRRGEIQDFMLPTCIAIIKAAFESAREGEEEKGTFTKTMLDVVLRTLEWMKRLNAVTGGGDDEPEDGFEAEVGSKEWLEGVIEALRKRVRGALDAIVRREEAMMKEEEEEEDAGSQSG
ncbi:uncharacterized protein DNG_07475 [Cephalotrichum gorgonifer]|uniref:Uncharacterized protein n=1 Tax=Cephalotrichum gorgonifer TaxID=2041049 RepID=A0AAE8N1U1_9PEZI|nr:uncharacterized protein DNG_07475 [Cephalotrichum gorgonifer]